MTFSSSSRADTNSILVFSLTAVSVLLWNHRPRRTRQQRTHDNDDDDAHLQRAHELRLGLDKPQHSHFRVVALLLLSDGSVVAGTNQEATPCISGSICAERAALLRLRMQACEDGLSDKEVPTINTVYIVSDALHPVPPGMLCREYLYGVCGPDLRIVLQSADATAHPMPWVLTLSELYPYPTIYMGLGVDGQVAMGKRYQNEAIEIDEASLELTGLSHAELDRLVQAAQAASVHDNQDSLHAIRYGAAAAILTPQNQLQIVTASQRKAVEYGASLDAVCQLVPLLYGPDGSRHSVLALCQVDQFGIAHAPFAAARSFLVEHYFDTFCIVSSMDSDNRLRRHAVTANELAPFVPHFKQPC